MKTTSIIAMALLGMFTTFTASAQNNVGIGTASPDAIAALEIESTTQGFLPPRLSSTQRDAIAAPVAVGLIVWCTNCGTNGEVQVYNGSAWTNMVGAAAALSLQERLDGGETPLAIYNSLSLGGSTSSAALDSLYGKTYQGGLIAYLDTTTGAGLIAAATDQSTGIQWTMSAHQSTTVPNGATDITNGFANTASIVAQAGVPAAGVDNYAAYLCDSLTLGGYADWYLPSKDELNYMFTNIHLKGLGGFDNKGHWSSTEEGSSKAKSVGFSSTTFNSNGFLKSRTKKVRAARAF